MEDKNDRQFRTMDEIKEDYNEEDKSFKENSDDVLQNLKDQLFSPSGILILLMLSVSIIGTLMR